MKTLTSLIIILICLSIGRSTGATAEQMEGKLVGGVEAERLKATETVEFTGTEYRDPFELPPGLRLPVAPPVSEVEPMPEAEIELSGIIIQGIVWGPKRPQAIINGEVYEKGEVVGEVKIIDIDKDGVTLLYKDRVILVQPKVEGRKIGEKR